MRGWIDRFATWRDQLARRVQAGQDVRSELETGAAIIQSAVDAAPAAASRDLAGWRDRLLADEIEAAATAALDPALAALMAAHDTRPHCADSDLQVTVQVDPPLARFCAWYELFPRSLGGDRHGTLRDVTPGSRPGGTHGVRHPLPAAAAPDRRDPPQGPEQRAGRGPGDPGSPWAIGPADGGHTAVHRELGTVADVRRLAGACAKRGIALALDLAFQCSPDHPWVREHPEWFRHRPDGSIRYAENPPKRYEDIYPLDFESEDWRGLWQELLEVVRFWIGQGVRVFRVDNPHTKPFPFWEWLIGEVKRDHPDVLFLAEAFTRPRVMERLAKAGFSQSYTYFTWRNGKHDLEEYLRELTQTGVREYFRPNFWPNTPDILTEPMQTGGRPDLRRAARARGDAQRRLRHLRAGVRARRAARPARRERGVPRLREVPAADVGHLEPRQSLEPLVTAINAARRAHPALQSNERLEFRQVANDMLIAYTKHTADLADVVLGVVNLDPHHTQSGWVELPLERLGIDPEHPLPGPRPAGRGDLHVAGAAQLRRARSRPAVGTPLPRPPAPAQRARLRVLRMIMPITMSELAPTLARTAQAGHWYKDAIIYEVHVRAFADSNGDGIGDFRGLTQQARLPRRTWASRRSGCCRSTPRRCGTTATTSPTTRDVHPDYGTLRRLPARSCATPTRAACGSSPSWC